MDNSTKFLITYLVAGFLLALAGVVRGESGFHRITETVTNMEETYQVWDHDVDVDVLDDKGEKTGKKIKRPVTRPETRRWKKKTITPGGPGITFLSLDSGDTTYYLGRDVDDLIANGHLEVAKDYMAVTYLESGVTPMRVSYREWKAISPKVDAVSFGPKYHYSGTPSITLTQEEFDSLQ